MTGNGADYRGMQTKTRSGFTCQNWTSKTPHSHNYHAIDTSKGIGDHNYCRNPSGSDGIWCYTTDSSKRWEYCNPIPLTCGEGTTEENGKCVSTLTCGDGTTEENGKCVSTLTCGDGTTEENGKCIHTWSCVSGMTNKCRLDYLTWNGKGGQNGCWACGDADGECVEDHEYLYGVWNKGWNTGYQKGNQEGYQKSNQEGYDNGYSDCMLKYHR